MSNSYIYIYIYIYIYTYILMFARIKWWSQHADLVEGRSRQRLDLPKKNRESIFIPINIPSIVGLLQLTIGQ